MLLDGLNSRRLQNRFSTSADPVDGSRREPLGPQFNTQVAQGVHSRDSGVGL